MTDPIVLIERAKAGEKEAREVLIEENLGLVHHIVKRFLGRGYDQEELFQIGVIGLIKSIDKFDCSYHVKFSTYAVPLIMGEIRRFLRDDGMIKVSRNVKENGMKVYMASKELMNEHNREPLLEEIALRAELSLEEVVLATEAGAQVESIYKSVCQKDGKEIYLVDQLADEHVNEQEQMMNRMTVAQLMQTLNETEQKLITLRYFQNKTQSAVAKELYINQVQVSRMEKKILQKMRQTLNV